ncbi:type IV pilus modification PilV family protein [Legionella bononiensis]|uniref:Prepilin-type N-terminal cleavage/methylation domain-containing protein n=1 Tax=Legionella bononiensis TaxID=2793102 RepID=A0ABS1WEA3_9GAMM|nr:prepilin-type N-terminal cleavage/methylation domain-containing protein [Legionella bononiensis]MBL7479454.1 prepilin-type N-terminal cleavage/methylation domain-containing protein [Legionella bononiensis]MBL7527672.1 prepilin-type N-terminal cleavage/methylation domain-containing protein [Legionella bononiensis]
MKQLKGFSLIEVLVSLMLVTTIALALLQQQWNTRQFINQLVLHAGASHFLDIVSESVYGQVSTMPPAPAPYHLNVRKESSRIIVQVEWFNRTESITRKVKKADVV